jgi:putative lipoprotein
MCIRSSIASVASAVSLAIVVTSCATTGKRESNEGVVTGTVAYRERMALPPDAVVRISLVDASRMGAPAPAIAETTVVAAGRQVPIPFRLRYDPTRIDQSHAYAVRAEIRSGDRAMFATDGAYRVITQGTPSQVDLRLVRVSTGDVGAAASQLNGTSWVLEDLGGTSALDQPQATLAFSDSGKVSGNGSCNRFNGTVRLSGDSIAFGPLATTRMACVDPAGKQETSYLKALGDAERFRVDGTTLLIYAKGMTQPLRFRKQQ